jgi:hypothetical protein
MNNQKTKAVVSVHSFRFMHEVRRLKMIADVAEAVGSNPIS